MVRYREQSIIVMLMTKTRRCILTFATGNWLFFLLVCWNPDGLALEEPLEYRTEQYDDVVPETLRGAMRVSAVEVMKLQQQNAALVIDVIPEQRVPEVLPAGQLWFPVPHMGVPDALWLPDVGYGVLSPVTDSYFRHHLTKATHGDKSHPLVFYCRADCWMSWNAAKRALSYGYTSVHWFADGLEDWMFEGFELEVLSPAEGQRQAQEQDERNRH
jgi:PQQ-dependent catabolism-associated CXXCW motif protein